MKDTYILVIVKVDKDSNCFVTLTQEYIDRSIAEEVITTRLYRANNSNINQIKAVLYRKDNESGICAAIYQDYVNYPAI